MKKVKKYIALLIFILSQSLFLWALFKTQSSILLLVVISIWAVGILHIKIGDLHFHPTTHFGNYKFLNYMLYALIGGVITFILSSIIGLGPVIGSATVGVIFGLYALTDWTQKELANCAYCGSFVGMTAPYVPEAMSLVVIGSLLAGYLFLIGRNVCNGVGGKSGLIAFAGLMMSMLILGQFVGWNYFLY